ncbi:MAG: pirin family protein [Actinobacteria bacterium]|nr:pirin family protein [Actinomycetota bacterium]MDA3017569.1 pirin family protein [Actinomycetota bacterium]
MTNLTERKILQIITSQSTVEGGGFKVRRPFPTQYVDHIDPFLLLDEMGPADYAPHKAVGAPSHPHRGFETVTYLLSGAMVHEDSIGTRAVIKPGGVQWMTAGSGVVHSELPTDDMMALGGRMHGFQLWVNLSADRKMIPPRYQGYDANELAQTRLPNGGLLKVVAGTVLGVTGPVETTSPMTYAHAAMQANETIEWTPDVSHTALVHVFDGEVTVNDQKVVSGQMVVFERSTGTVKISTDVANVESAQVLILGGAPLNEPVVRYGPFVMNTRQEIVDAVNDYQNGVLVR